MGAVRGGAAGVVHVPQDRIAPILGFISATVVGAMPDAAAEKQFATVAAAIALSTLSTGLFTYLLGRFGLGNLIRFIPYPVIGGFLAGSGWLLVVGSLRAGTGMGLEPQHFRPLFLEGGIVPWLPAAAFGLALFVITRSFRHWAVLPGCLVLAVAGFYAWLPAAGLDPAAARAQGWLLPLLGGGAAPWPAPGELLAQVDWRQIAGLSGAFTAIALTSAVSILLNSGALDVDLRRETDLNHELRVVGTGNLLAGLGGGMVGFASLSLSRLAREAGGHGRVVGAAAAVVCLACLAGNLGVVGVIPKFVLAGLLFHLGLLFLHEWLVLAWRRLPLPDYLAVVLILSVVGTVGYLQGVMVGLLTATILFVLNYSRVHIVSQALSGSEQRSNVDRPPEEQEALRDLGRRIHILRLQGFIFFGSANHLLATIRGRLEDPAQPPLEYVVLDFRRVYGLDSSAVLALRKLRDLAAARAFAVLVCGAGIALLRQMQRSGFELSGGPISVQDDRDHVLEWCEDRLLARRAGPGAGGPDRGLFARLTGFWPPDGPRPEQLAPYLEPARIPAGQAVMRQGEAADEMVFLESGRLTAILEGTGRGPVRLRAMSAGSVVGELGLYLGEPRSATIVADTDCTVFRLKKGALERMEREDALLAATFHRAMLRLTAARLVHTSRALQAVLD